MTSAFKIGDVCIWQNCTGMWAYLNGTETTVTSSPIPAYDLMTLAEGMGYPTDTPDPILGGFLCAAPHELRLKRPPASGEQMIRAMFDRAPEREEVPA